MAKQMPLKQTFIIVQNESGTNGRVDETTRRRTGKWAKRLGGERESGRNDPDSVQA